MDIMTIITLAVYMVAMLGIGYWSFRKTSTLSDYMLAGRNLGPAVTALSAGASDMSSWMVMALPGAFYAYGLSEIWLPIGLSLGAYINYFAVAPRLRVYSELAKDSITVPDYLENRFEDTTRVLRLVAGFFIVVFFAIYAASGMVAGGKMFESAFGSGYHTGLYITLAVIVFYTLFGGFLAVSTTDFVQGIIMFIALVLVPLVAFTDIGGDYSVVNELNEINPTMFSLFAGETVLGIIGLLAWGVGYFGQPHIIVRFMAIRSHKDLKVARRVNIIWMVVGLIGASAAGLIGAAYFANNGGGLEDPETVLIEFANILFHPIITGFVLAAILAAVMSTVASQLLVTSSAITEDLYRAFLRKGASDKELIFIGRLSVLVVGVVAAWIANNPDTSILSIVSNAWAGFGATFGAVILVSLHWKKMTKWGAIAGVVVGGLTVIIWIITGLSEWLYELVPGFLLSLLALYVVSKVTKQPSGQTEDTFTEMETQLKQK